MARYMSQSTRNEYLEKMRNRYRRYTGKQARTKLITEFCEVTSHERKYAIKLLRRRREPGCRSPVKKRGVGKIYGEEVIKVLFEIWRHSEQPCGKRLRPMAKEWLPYYERHIGALTNETKIKVQQISCAQINRVLADRKAGESRRKPRMPKANAAIKALFSTCRELGRQSAWLDRVGYGGSLWRKHGRELRLEPHSDWHFQWVDRSKPVMKSRSTQRLQGLHSHRRAVPIRVTRSRHRQWRRVSKLSFT